MKKFAAFVMSVGLVGLWNCGNHQVASTVKGQGEFDRAHIADHCQAEVLRKIHAKFSYGSLESAQLKVLDYFDTTDGILAEIDLNDSETDRVIASFNAKDCGIEWSKDFTTDRWNTPMNPELQAATNKAIERCKPAVVKELAKAAGIESADDATLDLLAYSTETQSPDLLFVEATMIMSETYVWVASIDASTCKAQWKHEYAFER